MPAIHCTTNDCAVTPAEPMPGTQLPCGGLADCMPDGGGGTGGLTSVATTDSETVDFSGNGTGGNPLTAGIKISTAPGNLLVIGDDGLQVLLPEFESYFDMAVSVTESWAANEVIFAHQFSADSKIPANWSESIGILEGHVGDTTLLAQINGVTVSTIPVDGEIITFPPMAEQTANRGDVFTLVSTSVETFDYAAITLVASRAVRYV